MRVSRFAKRTLLTATAILSSSVAAHAGPIAAGVMEYSPTVAFNRSSYTAAGATSTSVTHLDVTGTAARAFSDHYQLSAGVIVQHRDLAGTGFTGEGGMVGGQYNFNANDNLIPYVSAGLGFVQFSSNGINDRSVLVPMLRVGFRSMIGETRSLNVSFGYQHEVNPKSSLNDSGNMFDVGVGMSIFRGQPQH
jgi:hypothetical protein